MLKLTIQLKMGGEALSLPLVMTIAAVICVVFVSPLVALWLLSH